ncbi:hypothetical protein SBADM41S_04031 [Streptomyces badius]
MRSMMRASTNSGRRQHRPERLQDLPDRLVELLLPLVAAQDLGVERLDDTGRGVLRAGGVGRVGDDRHLIQTFRGRLVRVGAPVPEDATGQILPCGPTIFEDHPHTAHDQAFSPTAAPHPYGGIRASAVRPPRNNAPAP